MAGADSMRKESEEEEAEKKECTYLLNENG